MVWDHRLDWGTAEVPSSWRTVELELELDGEAAYSPSQPLLKIVIMRYEVTVYWMFAYHHYPILHRDVGIHH